MTESRRRYDRVPYFESCTVIRNSGQRAIYETLDMGAGGFAFQCDQPFLEGEQITAMFGEHIKEQCIVAYCSAYQNDAFRVGVRFLKARDRE